MVAPEGVSLRALLRMVTCLSLRAKKSVLILGAMQSKLMDVTRIRECAVAPAGHSLGKDPRSSTGIV